MLRITFTSAKLESNYTYLRILLSTEKPVPVLHTYDSPRKFLTTLRVPVPDKTPGLGRTRCALLQSTSLLLRAAVNGDRSAVVKTAVVCDVQDDRVSRPGMRRLRFASFSCRIRRTRWARASAILDSRRRSTSRTRQPRPRNPAPPSVALVDARRARSLGGEIAVCGSGTLRLSDALDRSLKQRPWCSDVLSSPGAIGRSLQEAKRRRSDGDAPTLRALPRRSWQYSWAGMPF